MVRQSYPGLGGERAAVQAFTSLSPYAAELRRLQSRCKPFGRDYMALAIALDGLESAAFHFTRWPHFYGAMGDASGTGGQPHGQQRTDRGRASRTDGHAVRYQPSLLAHRP